MNTLGKEGGENSGRDMRLELQKHRSTKYYEADHRVLSVR
jgi:hypothetical protein